jgi:hypothetical protein
MAAKKNPQKKIEDAYQEALGRFGHRPDVTGIDIGYKYKNGERRETLAVRLHVKNIPKVSTRSFGSFSRGDRRFSC